MRHIEIDLNPDGTYAVRVYDVHRCVFNALILTKEAMLAKIAEIPPL